MMFVNIYEYFSGFSKEEVKLAINSLNMKYQSLLNKYYDINGNFLADTQLTRTDYITLEYIMTVLITGTLKNQGNINMLSLYEICWQEKRDEIDEVISTLSFSYRANALKREKFIKSRDNDYTVEENVVFLKKILPLIQRKLKRQTAKETSVLIKDNKCRNLRDILREYSWEEIEEVLKFLSTDEKHLLSFRYDKMGNFRSEALFLSPELKMKIDTLVYNKIKKSLKTKRIINMHNSNLYLVLSKYPKEVVDRVLRCLTSKEREILYLKYDSNFDVYLQFKETLEYQRQRDYLIKVKIPRIIKSEAYRKDSLKNLDVIYENHSREDILTGISRLAFAKKSLIEAYYSSLTLRNSYINEEDKNELEQIIYTDLQRILGYFSMQDKDNLFVKLNAYSKEEIILAIGLLSKEEKDLLKLRYDDNYNLKESAKHLDKETIKRINKVVSKIIRYLKNKDSSLEESKSLFTRFSRYPKEDVLLVLDNLSREEKTSLGKFYDDDYKRRIEDVPCSEHEFFQYHNLVHRKIPRLLSNKGKFIESLNLLRKFKDCSKSTINQGFKSLSIEEMALLELKYDYNYDYRVSYLNLDSNTKIKVEAVVAKLKSNLEFMSNRRNYSNDLFYKYSGYSKEDIFKVIRSLKETELASLFSKYDEELMVRKDFNTLDNKEKYQVYRFFYDIFNKRLDKLKKDNSFEENRLKIVNFVLDNPCLNELNTTLDNNIIMILLMSLGYANGIKYSKEDISKYLSLDVSFIESVINLYQEKEEQKLVLKR